MVVEQIYFVLRVEIPYLLVMNLSFIFLRVCNSTRMFLLLFLLFLFIVNKLLQILLQIPHSSRQSILLKSHQHLLLHSQLILIAI